MNLPLKKKQEYYISSLDFEADKKEARLNFNFLNRKKKAKKFKKNFKLVVLTKENLRELTEPKKEVTEVKSYLKNHFGMSVLDIQAEKLLEFTKSLNNKNINEIEVNE